MLQARIEDVGLKVITYSRSVENMKRTGQVPEGNGNGQAAIMPAGPDGQVQQIQQSLNLAEFEQELRILRSQVQEERTRRETLGTEHMQLITQI